MRSSAYCPVALLPPPHAPVLPVALLFALLQLGGCGAAAGPPTGQRADPGGATLAERHGAEPATRGVEAEAAREGEDKAGRGNEAAGNGQGERPELNAIPRAELEAFLRRGPQDFIQIVRVRPAFRDGRFWGWRIVAYTGPGPLLEGDIVRRVNGQSIERPEQFMSVWASLAGRDHLEVDLVRGGRRVLLRYRIVGPGGSPPARSNTGK